MDNVKLLNKHITNINIISVDSGKWEKGKYIEENKVNRRIKGVYLPVSTDVFKYYPQGAVTLKDRELFTKENLKEGDIAIINGEEFKIVESTSFDYLADIKIYLLKRSTKDD